MVRTDHGGGSRGSQGPGDGCVQQGAACQRQGAGGERWTLGKTHLPCSTSPMVVPEVAVDMVAGAVVCLPTASTRLETRGGEGRTQTRWGRGGGEKRQRKQKKLEFKSGCWQLQHRSPRRE